MAWITMLTIIKILPTTTTTSPFNWRAKSDKVIKQTLKTEWRFYRILLSIDTLDTISQVPYCALEQAKKKIWSITMMSGWECEPFFFLSLVVFGFGRSANLLYPVSPQSPECPPRQPCNLKSGWHGQKTDGPRGLTVSGGEGSRTAWREPGVGLKVEELREKKHWMTGQ